MSSSATVASDFKDAFFAAAQQLMAANADTRDVLVSFGKPGTFEALDLVVFDRVAETQHPAAVSTNRSRDEEIVLTVHISVARPGGNDMEQVCSQRAYALLRMLETYCRVTDTTMGGLVRWCFLDNHESSGESDDYVLEKARVIYITAHFKALARITT